MRARVLLLTLALALGAPLLSGLPGVGSARAQSQLVEEDAQVEVPVYDDNLDDAKSRAIAQGQQAALRSVLEKLLAPEWITLFDKELRRRVLSRVERYMASYRVQRQEPSFDRTRFIVSLSAQVNRAALVEDLHDLNLPVLGERARSLAAVYESGDPVLGNAALRAQVEEKLRGRLALLGFQARPFAAVRGDAANALANPQGSVPDRVRALKPFGTSTVLFIAFQPPASSGGDALGAKASLRLYDRLSGESLADLEVVERNQAVAMPGRTSRERDVLVARLVDPLVLQLQPGAIRIAQRPEGKAAELRLRVLGFHSVEDQERFEQAFFRRNTPFARFSLYSFAPQAVTYEGPYGGDRAALESDLRGQQLGEFRIRNVYWFNDVLELDVERQSQPTHSEMRMYPRERRPPDVAAVIDDFLGRYTQLDVEDPLYTEVEDNGWLSRANAIPFNATVYAQVDSRSDSDMFVGEALASGEKVVLTWHRQGRTNLTPAIRLYDENGVLVNTFTPKSFLRYEYTVPKGQHRFFMEVGDRFGYLKVDTGGYLSFHYLFKVQRSGP